MKKVIVILLIIALVAAVMMSPLFEITKISVDAGESDVDIAKVIEESQIHTGQNIFRVSLKAAKRHIKAIPYIEEVSARRVLPGEIKIAVQKGVVAANVTCENGAVLGITKNGLILVDGGESERAVPDVRGLTVKGGAVGDMASADDARKLEVLCEYLTALTDGGLIERTTTIDITFTDDLEIVYGGKLLIKFGEPENIELKILHTKELLNSYLGEDAFGTIDISDPENVSYLPDITE